jgi:hypothetical protein
VGWVLDRMGQLPVERGQHDTAAVAAAIGRLRSGACIGVFPEGTRSAGRALRARSGAGRLALAVPDAAIVCAAAAGVVDIARFPKRPRFAFSSSCPRHGSQRCPEPGSAITSPPNSAASPRSSRAAGRTGLARRCDHRSGQTCRRGRRSAPAQVPAPVLVGLELCEQVGGQQRRRRDDLTLLLVAAGQRGGDREVVARVARSCSSTARVSSNRGPSRPRTRALT